MFIQIHNLADTSLIIFSGLNLDKEFPDQMDTSSWQNMRSRFTEKFSSKTRDEWCEIFDGTDACVSPVLSLSEAPKHQQNVANDVFIANSNGMLEPSPAPKLSRTPGHVVSLKQPSLGQDTCEALKECGYSLEDIAELKREAVTHCGVMKSSL